MTMIETVARAICDSTEADNFDALPADGIVRASYMQQARAAIEAMREPTITMAVAGSSFAWFEGRTDEIGNTITTWQAMIDSALAS